MQVGNFTLVVFSLGVLAAAGCEREPPPPPPPGAMASTQPSTWINTITLGTPDDPVRGVGGRVPKFEEGERIVLQIDARGAPANTPFTAIWFGPDGRELGRRTLNPTMGQDLLSFTAPAAGAIGPGDHRVELLAGASQIADRPFTVVAQSQ